jgi:hypothetical protein
MVGDTTGRSELLMPCKFTVVVGQPFCDFKGKVGDQVTLTLKGTVGLVFFEKAEYAGIPISGVPATDITFTLKAGSFNLDVAYAFSQGTAGRGELHEKCEGNTLLDDWVRGDNAVERYHICTDGDDS